MENPLVSIITVSSNGEKYISHMIESILKQNYDNIEYIFIDKGSTDNTKNIISNYKSKFNKFHYKYIEASSESNAINEALKFFSGDYLCFIDPNNFYLDNNIERRVEILENNKELAIVLTNGFNYNSDDLLHPISQINNNKDRLKNNQFQLMINNNSSLSTASFMIRADSFLSVFPDKKIIENDSIKNLQILLPLYNKLKYKLIDEHLYGDIVNELSSFEEKVFETAYNKLINNEKFKIEVLSNIQKNSSENIHQLIRDIEDELIPRLIIDLAMKFNKYDFIIENTLKLKDKNKANQRDLMILEKCYQMQNPILKIAQSPKCNGCHACMSICPKDCIKMTNISDAEGGFWYPRIDYSKCIKCRKCENVCPVYTPIKIESKLIAYAGYNKDEKIRKTSTSGGIFSAIASYVIENKGVVFGACYNKDFDVVHDYAETFEDFEKFKVSKYVQSLIGNTLKQAKQFLDQGRLVLFTGTPCQIGGLKNFLGKEYDNLITQDLICHGVPSPYIFKRYRIWKENIAGCKITNINFRDKTNYNWEKLFIKLEYANFPISITPSSSDLMFDLFLKNLVLRKSCYDCSFKTASRCSDFTLADYWGIPDKYRKSMEADKGVSLVLVHSDKAVEVIDKIKDKIVVDKLNDEDFNNIANRNTNLVKSTGKNSNRDNYLKAVSNGSFPVISEHFLRGG